MASHLNNLNRAGKKADTGSLANKKRSGPQSGKSTEVRGRNRVSEAAAAAIDVFVQATIQTGIEGLKREFADVKTYTPADMSCTKFQENEERNRYKDVLCLDATRVVLNLNVPPETDYIHANWIKLDGVDRNFIACQAPMENTTSDFWRMVHQENIQTIIMLCRTHEDGKNKCFQYFPHEHGSFKTYGTMFVNNKKTEAEDRFITFTLEVLPEGCSNSVVVKLIQMVDWPDRGTPLSTMSVLRLLRMIPNTKHAGGTVMHCSAGVGRTGAILLIETAIQRLLKGQVVNMKKIVCELRDRRASMLQTEGQYVFAHTVVLGYINAKMPKHHAVVIKFLDQFRQTQFS